MTYLKEYIHFDPKISTLLVPEFLKQETLNVDFTLFLLENRIIDSDVWDRSFAQTLRDPVYINEESV